MIAQAGVSPPKKNAPLCDKRRAKVRIAATKLVSVRAKRNSLHPSPAQEIRQSLRLETELEGDGHQLIKDGPRLKCLCPFHQERTPSCFVDPELGLFHCFGCGASGSVIDYHARKLGVSVRDAIRQLTRRLTFGDKPRPNVQRHSLRVEKFKPLKKIRGNGFELGTDDDFRKLAGLRNLGMEGLQMAQTHGGLRFATFHDLRAWIITDKDRFAAQARRLDGQDWEHLGCATKAWTLPGSCASWPIGLGHARNGSRIALVEGGPDFLAAFHLMSCEGREDVRPVALLGAANSIHPSALSLFNRQKVRIFPHCDEAGTKAARRWHHQLVTAGAMVDWYDLTGLRRSDGQPVKDLNDFVLIDSDEWKETQREEVLP